MMAARKAVMETKIWHDEAQYLANFMYKLPTKSLSKQMMLHNQGLVVLFCHVEKLTIPCGGHVHFSLRYALLAFACACVGARKSGTMPSGLGLMYWA